MTRLTSFAHKRDAQRLIAYLALKGIPAKLAPTHKELPELSPGHVVEVEDAQHEEAKRVLPVFRLITSVGISLHTAHKAVQVLEDLQQSGNGSLSDVDANALQLGRHIITVCRQEPTAR